MHRVATKWWLIAADNQLENSSHLNGLVDFMLTPEWLMAEWRLWEHLGLSIDLGSDGVAAVSAMIYKWAMNVLLFPDESHSCKNSLIGIGLVGLVAPHVGDVEP